MKRNLMKEAHKMTREIKEQYPEVDYQAQLGLCLSFLAQEEEEKEMEGPEKQVKYDTDLMEKEIPRLENMLKRKERKAKEGKIYDKETYRVRKTGEKLELTVIEAIEMTIQILGNMTKAWEIINACQYPDVRIIINHYGQYR